jgi:hypothetical protein
MQRMARHSRQVHRTQNSTNLSHTPPGCRKSGIFIDPQQGMCKSAAHSPRSESRRRTTAGIPLTGTIEWADTPWSGRQRMRTAFGQIARLTQTTADVPSPLQKEIVTLSRLIAALALTIGAVVFVIGRFITTESCQPPAW